MTSAAVGGFGVGFLEQQFGDQLPEIPLLGRKGTIAAAIYFWNPSAGWAKDIGVAAAAIAGYELGGTGRITGDAGNPYFVQGDDDWLDDEDDEDDDELDLDDDDDWIDEAA